MSSKGARVAFGVVVVFVALTLVTISVASLVGMPTPNWNIRPFIPSPGGPSSSGGSAVPEADILATIGDPKTSGLNAWPDVIDAAVTVYDIDGDGVQEIVAHSNDTIVYVFDSSTGRTLAQLPTTHPPGWYIESVLNAPVVATLAPGQNPSVVITNHAAFVSAWQFVPSESTATSFTFEKSWERRVNTCFKDSGMDAPPVPADLDGDGTLEILVQTEENGLFALNHNGTTLWHHCWSGGNAAPVAADVDGDGSLEAVFASDDGYLAVFEGATGNPIWTFDAGADAHGVSPASVPVAPTVAQLDGKGGKEILFIARHAPVSDPDAFDTFHMAIFAVHQSPTTHKGALLWMRQPDWAHPLSYTHLVVEDVDDDGKPDIFGMDWNTIGHLPGNWENLGPAHAFRLDADGQDVWVRQIDSWWSNKDVTLVNHGAELLVNGADRGVDGLWSLDTADGKPIAFMGVHTWKLMRGPVITDLYGDGSTQAVLPVAPDSLSRRHGAILVIDVAASRST